MSANHENISENAENQLVLKRNNKTYISFAFSNFYENISRHMSNIIYTDSFNFL